MDKVLFIFCGHFCDIFMPKECANDTFSQDQMEDMMYEADEIQQVLGRSYGINDDIDEAELEAEFDALGNVSPEDSILYPRVTISSNPIQLSNNGS